MVFKLQDDNTPPPEVRPLFDELMKTFFGLENPHGPDAAIL